MKENTRRRQRYAEDPAWRAKVADKCREYYEKNREKVCQKVATYRAENLEKIKAYDRERSKTEPRREQARKISRRQREEDPGRWKRFYWKTPEKYRTTNRLNQHRRRAAGDGVTAEQWEEILEYHDHRCAYCLERRGELQMEHLVAISRGGRNDPENIVPACPSCNYRKGAKPVFMMVGLEPAVA